MNELHSHPKYQALLSTGKELFWKYGFKRVSIEEVCQKANVSKMTFYKFFRNKLELAKAVFDTEANEAIRRFRQIMDSDMPPSEKMKQMLIQKMEGTNEISREFVQEFYSNPELGLSSYIDQKTKELWSEIIIDFRKAQEKGWFRNDFKPEFILFFSQKIVDLMKDENLLKIYANPQELIMEIANFFTYGIAPHE